MASSIARQPWRLGSILLLLAVAVTALLITQALAPESGEQNGAQIVESGGSPQISETVSPQARAATATIANPASTPGPGMVEPLYIAPVFPGAAGQDLPPVDDPPVIVIPVPGSLTGLIWQTDIMDGTLEGITVYLATAAGSLTGLQTLTSADGRFSFPELAPGTYKLYFLDPNSVYEPGWYGQPDVPQGAVVEVRSGADTSVTQQMRAARAEGYGTIRGRVTDGSGTGVAGVDVYAYAVEDGAGQLLDLKGHSVTDELGYYTLPKLPPAGGGSEPGAVLGYKIQFAPPPQGGLAAQWYLGQGTHATAKIIPLKASEEITGIDAVLDGGGTISGSVGGGGAPLAWMLVDFYDESGLIADSQLTDAQGEFKSRTLAPGKYRIHVTGGNGFQGEWYNDKKDMAGSDPVTVLSGQDSSGIHFQLEEIEEEEPVDHEPTLAVALPEEAVQMPVQMPPAGSSDDEGGAPGEAGTETGTETGSGDSAGQTAPAQIPDGVLPSEQHEEELPGKGGQKQVPHGQAQADDPGQPGMQLSGQNL